MRNYFFRLVLSASLLSLPGFLLSGCSDSIMQPSNASDDVPPQEVAPVVEAVETRFGSLPLSERVNGTVVSENQVALYPEISGKITRVLVQDGDFVRRGQPLVHLADREYREQLEQAQARYRVSQAAVKQARAQLKELAVVFERTEALSREGLISEVEVETQRAQMASAEADIELAEAQLQQAESVINETQEILEKTVVRAPITGTIGQRNAEVGMQVSPSTRLFTIGNLDALRIKVVLTEGMLARIHVGQTARVYVGSDDGTGESFLSARLSRISPFLNTVTRSTEAEIDLADTTGRLKPGMFVAVDILYGESRQATLIPTSALYTNPTTREEGVYVLRTTAGSDGPSEWNGEDSELSEPTEVFFQPVRVVAEGRLEVGIEGVESGRWVVTLGQDLLAEGRQRARVRFTSWDHILELQQLQRQDLLRQVLDTVGLTTHFFFLGS